MIAVSLSDLTSLNQGGFSVTAILLHDFVSDDPKTVWVDRKYVDTEAVILDGPATADPDRLTALVELLQTVLGPRKLKRRVRCYEQGKRGGWREIRL